MVSSTGLLTGIRRPLMKHRMGQFGSIILAMLFLSSLWVYQLPRSPVERYLMSFFRPIQRVMYTNRQYRMYAPEPRSRKLIPYLVLTNTDGHSTSYGFRDSQVLGKDLNWFAAEKWSQFIYHLSKSLLHEWPIYPAQEGKSNFTRMAQYLCEMERPIPIHTITFGYRPVIFETYRTRPQWQSFQQFGHFDCQTASTNWNPS